MRSSPQCSVLDLVLGPPPDASAVLYVCSNPPGAAWSQRTASSIVEAADLLERGRTTAEAYCATAWFAPGGGRSKAAVVAKRTISLDIDDKAMPGADAAERHHQARTVAGAIPVPTVLIDSGGGFHAHVLLPEGERFEDFADPEDGRRHVEILGIALRLHAEQAAIEQFGTPAELDATDGIERCWRIPPSHNMKAEDGSKALTHDPARWRKVSLVRPARPDAVKAIPPADLMFLQPFIEHASEVWDTRQTGKSGDAATLASGTRKQQGSEGASVAVATPDEPFFDHSVLPHRLRSLWPLQEGDQSAHDWAIACCLAEAGYAPWTAVSAIRVRRALLRVAAAREKGERWGYAEQTVEQAYRRRSADAQDASRLEYIPFPLQVLPEPVERYVALSAEAMRCSPEAILLPLLTGLGVAIGASRRLLVKTTWIEPPVLWTCVVMSSGYLKTPAMERGLAHFNRRHADSIREHRAALKSYEVEKERYELRLKAWRHAKDADSAPPVRPEPPVARRITVSDTTLEGLVPLLEQNPRGLLLARDELSGWFKSHGAYKQGRGGDLEHWLSIFSGASITVDRKGDDSVHFVENPFIGICGGMQPHTLRLTLTREMFGSGAAARFLFAMPDPPDRRWSEDEVPASVFRAMERLIDRLFSLEIEQYADGSSGAVVIPFDGEAKGLWKDHFNALGTRMKKSSRDHDFRAALSKLEGYAPRLALLIEHCNWAAGPVSDPPTHVGAASLRAAIEACEWFERETRRVYEMIRSGEDLREHQPLIDWIHGRGGRPVTPRDVQRSLRAYRESTKKAQAALDALVALGVGWWIQLPPPRTGGHATQAFVLRDDGAGGGDGDARSGGSPFAAGRLERVSPPEEEPGGTAPGGRAGGHTPDGPAGAGSESTGGGLLTSPYLPRTRTGGPLRLAQIPSQTPVDVPRNQSPRVSRRRGWPAGRRSR